MRQNKNYMSHVFSAQKRYQSHSEHGKVFTDFSKSPGGRKYLTVSIAHSSKALSSSSNFDFYI